jgi:hypothetical protein
MSTAPQFPSFDGLLGLSKHKGVDIRPTLLRVLTDLYVQTQVHSQDERQQYAELASRLIDAVDEATLTAVRAKLISFGDTPTIIAEKLGLKPAGGPVAVADVGEARPAAAAQAEPGLAYTEVASAAPARLAIRPGDAAEIDRLFSGATAIERARILQNLSESPLVPAVRPGPLRSARAIETLEMAAFASDIESFAIELANTLLLPATTAERIVGDAGGEPLACACKAIGMSEEIFQRVLLFLKPAVGATVIEVFRLARLYSVLGERAALIMISVWRGATIARAEVRHVPGLYDDERRRGRTATHAQGGPGRPALQVSRSRTGS